MNAATARTLLCTLNLSLLALGMPTPAAVAQEPTATPNATPIPITLDAPDPAAPTEPSTEPRRRVRRPLRVGPNVGVFLPADPEVRRLFGDTWTTFNFGIGRMRPTRVGGQWRDDSYVMFKNRGGNRAFLMPVGLDYRMPFGRPDRPRPFVSVGGNLLITELRAESAGIRRGIRTGWGASIAGGVELGGSGFFEARYRAATDIRGLGMSGTNLTLGLRF